MRFWLLRIAPAFIASLVLCAQRPEAPAPDHPVNEPQGIPPRAGPSDYQAQAKAGAVTIAAEFDEHNIPTPDGPLTTDSYVVVEAALFGGPANLQLSFSDFSLRINGKKAAIPGQPYGLVIESVKDPSLIPPEKEKSKTSLGAGGGQPGDPPPEPFKVPFEVQRAMAQRVKRASLAEGDRPLPQAGLLYFPYGGKAKGIHAVELIYSGPTGTATLKLQP